MALTAFLIVVGLSLLAISLSILVYGPRNVSTQNREIVVGAGLFGLCAVYLIASMLWSVMR